MNAKKCCCLKDCCFYLILADFDEISTRQNKYTQGRSIDKERMYFRFSAYDHQLGVS